MLQARDLARLSCTCKDLAFLAGLNSLWEPLLKALPLEGKLLEQPEPGTYKFLYSSHMHEEVSATKNLHYYKSC